MARNKPTFKQGKIYWRSIAEEKSGRQIRFIALCNGIAEKLQYLLNGGVSFKIDMRDSGQKYTKISERKKFLACEFRWHGVHLHEMRYIFKEGGEEPEKCEVTMSRISDDSPPKWFWDDDARRTVFQKNQHQVVICDIDYGNFFEYGMSTVVKYITAYCVPRTMRKLLEDKTKFYIPDKVREVAASAMSEHVASRLYEESTSV